jgi:hypothetical protein
MGFGGGGSGDLEIRVIAQGIQEVSKQIEDLDKKLSGVGKSSEGAAGGVGLLDSGIAKAALGAVTFTAAMGALTGALDNALRVENLTSGFNNLQDSIGNNATDKMNALKEATNGLISSMDLMQSSNQAVLLGVDDGSGKFEKLSGAALKLGASMGITAKEALDSLVVGIGRGSKLVLDNLGIMVDSEKAYRDYAKSINTTADALTDAQKKLAFQAAAFDAVNESAAGLADPADTAAGAYARLKVSISELIDKMSTAVSDSDRLKNSINLANDVVNNAPSAWERFKSVLSTVGDYVASVTNAIDNFIGVTGAKWGAFVSLLSDFKFPSPSAVNARAQESLNVVFAEQEKFKQKWQEMLALGKTPVDPLSIFGGGDFVGELQRGSLELSKYAASMSGGGGGKSVEDAAKKAKSALDALRDSVKGAGSKGLIEDLSKDLFSAEARGDSALASNLKNQIKDALNKGARESYLGKGGIMTPEAAGLLSQQVEQEFKKVEEKNLEEQKKSHAEGVSFWSGLMEDAITQSRFSWEDQLKKGSVVILSDFLSGFQGITETLKTSFEGLGGNLKDIFNELTKGSEASISAIETSFAAAMPALVAGFSLQLGQSVFSSVSKGEKISSKDQGGLALGTGLATGGLGNVAAGVYNSIIGGGKSKGDIARSQIESWLEETLGENVVFDKFTNNFSEAFDTIAGESRGAFETIGEHITNLVGVTEDVGAQIGYILSDNFGGTIDDLKYLVADLGISFEEVQETMVQAFLAGEQSASQVVAALAGIEEAFKPGLNGVGMFTAAMDNLIGSMGQGQESLKSLKDLAVEFKETGGKTLAEFQVALENSGKYTSSQITTLFQALSNKGITSLDQLAGASDITLIGIIADLERLGFQFSDSIGEGVKDSIKDINSLRESLNKLPDTVEKNLKIKVSTEYSDAQAQGALKQLTGAPGLARA